MRVKRGTIEASMMQPRRGATLLELAVSIGVGAVIFAILGAVFLAQGQFLAIEDAIAETQLNAFQAIDATGLHASSAKQVISSKTINGTAYATSDTLVILELPTIDIDDDVVSGSYDYVAIGQDPGDSTKFIVDLEPDGGSSRVGGKHTKALLVDKVIFRYNTVDSADADALDLYIQTSKDARGSTIVMPLGKIYFLGSS